MSESLNQIPNELKSVASAVFRITNGHPGFAKIVTDLAFINSDDLLGLNADEIEAKSWELLQEEGIPRFVVSKELFSSEEGQQLLVRFSELSEKISLFVLLTSTAP